MNKLVTPPSATRKSAAGACGGKYPLIIDRRDFSEDDLRTAHARMRLKMPFEEAIQNPKQARKIQNVAKQLWSEK